MHEVKYTVQQEKEKRRQTSGKPKTYTHNSQGPFLVCKSHFVLRLLISTWRMGSGWGWGGEYLSLRGTFALLKKEGILYSFVNVVKTSLPYYTQQWKPRETKQKPGTNHLPDHFL